MRLTLGPGLTATLWIPSGLTVAVLLKSRKQDWTAILLTTFAVNFAIEYLIYGFALPAAFLVPTGNILEPLAGASLVLMRCEHPFRFRNLNDVLSFVVLAGVVSPMIGATFGASAGYLSGIAPFAPAWVLWWLGDATGVIVVGPLVIASIRFARGSLSVTPPGVAEMALLLVGLSIAAHFRLTGILPFGFMVLPFLVWAAVRFGITGAALAVAMLAGMTFGYILAGFGPFTGMGYSQFGQTIIIQCFIAVVGTSTLLLGAVTEQRDEAISKLEDLTRDLADRVRKKAAELLDAAKAVTESEERLRLALEGADAVEWKWDILEDRLAWSNRYRELYGFAADDPSSYDLWLQRLHKEDRERVGARINAMLQSANDDLWREEFRIDHPGRGTVWLAGLGRLKRDDQGRPESMSGINYDITQQRRVEQELRLNQAAQSRLARLGALGELAAGIAHEINQPLTAAGTFARLSASILAADNSQTEKAMTSALQAADQIERASGVIRGLREMIRVGRASLESIDLQAAINSAIEIVKPESEKAGVTIHVAQEFAPPTVMADMLQLQQVLINLLRNAIEAISARGQKDGRIWIASSHGGDGFIEIDVSDNGPGFASEQIGKTPQYFSTTKEDGMGFGLPLSASIVKAHGGKIWIGENNPGGSVRFCLRTVKT